MPTSQQHNVAHTEDTERFLFAPQTWEYAGGSNLTHDGPVWVQVSALALH